MATFHFSPTNVLNELEQSISCSDVISFDFFDTLFVRTILDPEDAFDIVGRRFGIDNYREIRRAAQVEAFRRMQAAGLREITLEGIYACIAPIKSISSAELMHAEYEVELSLVQPNAELIEVFSRLLQSSKTVVITSDMYLPFTFFQECLAKNCLQSVEMFISSERNATKRDCGQLFEIVATELGVAPGRILHIGDNLHSDVNQAKIKGFRTFHYNERRRPPLLHAYSPEASLARGLIRKHCDEIETDSFKELGFLYGGPAAVGYLDWIAKQAEKDQIDHILFLARDGYVLDSIARTSGAWSLPGCSYFYGSRTLFTLAAMTYKNFFDFIPYLVSGSDGLSPRDLLARIDVIAPAPNVMKDLGLADSIVVGHDRLESIVEFLYSYRWEILKTCSRNRRFLRAYLRQLGVQRGDRVALIDIGWSGTTQDAFELAIDEIFDVETFGYYFCLADTPECDKRKKFRRMKSLFSTESVSKDLLSEIYVARAAIELFFSAPHDTVVGLDKATDGKIYAVTDPGRGVVTDLSLISTEITTGIEEFAKSFCALREQTKIPTRPTELAMPLIEFVTSDSWASHMLLKKVVNFDAWSSTSNRSIHLNHY